MGGNRGHGARRPQADRDSLAAIDAAVEAGINWVDTAPVYGDGHAERVLAKALARHGRALRVAGKVGLLPAPDGQRPVACLRAASVRRQVDETLARLGREQLDLCQVHWPHPKAQLEEGWQALLDLRQAGKIAAAGVCNFALPQLQALSPACQPASCQLPFNPIARGAARAVIPHCVAQGIDVLAYAPLRAGLLGGAFPASGAAALGASDWRRREPDFRPPLLACNLALAGRLGALAAELGLSTPALLVAWCLAQPGIGAIIVGARDARQISDSAAGAGVTLGEPVLARIESMLAERDACARACRVQRVSS